MGKGLNLQKCWEISESLHSQSVLKSKRYSYNQDTDGSLDAYIQIRSSWCGMRSRQRQRRGKDEMHTERIDIGKAVKEFRKEHNTTKEQLAETLRISVSYLEKIEAGRRPGMDTYQKLLDLLEADMVIHRQIETVQEKCAGKVKEILLDSTEAQAVFMTSIMEAVAQNIKLVLT